MNYRRELGASLNRLDLALSETLRGGRHAIRPVERDALFSALNDLKHRINSMSDESERVQSQLAIARFGLNYLGRLAEEIGDSSFLSRALDLLVEAVQAERGALFLVNRQDRETFVTHGTPGSEPREFSRTIINRVMTEGRTLDGRQVKSGKFNLSDSMHAIGIKDFLCVPFGEDEDTRGAVYLDRRKSMFPFPVHAVPLVEDFSSVLGRILRQLAMIETREQPQAASVQSLLGLTNGKTTVDKLPTEKQLIDSYKRDLEKAGYSNLEIANILGIGESTFYRRWPRR